MKTALAEVEPSRMDLSEPVSSASLPTRHLDLLPNAPTALLEVENIDARSFRYADCLDSIQTQADSASAHRLWADGMEFIQHFTNKSSLIDALVAISLDPETHVAKYFNDMVYAYTASENWRALSLHRYIFDKVAGVHSVCDELRSRGLIQVSREDISETRKRATTIPFEEQMPSLPRHYCEDLLLFCFKVAEKSGISFNPRVETIRFVNLIGDTRTKMPIEPNSFVIDEIICRFDKHAKDYIESLSPEQKNSKNTITRVLNALSALKCGLSRLALVDDGPIALPQSMTPSNEIPIAKRWLDETFPPGSGSRRATRNSFWTFLQFTSETFGIELNWAKEGSSWEEIQAAKERGQLLTDLMPQNSGSLTPKLLTNPEAIVKAYFEHLLLAVPNPAQVANAVISFYRWCNKIGLTDFQVPQIICSPLCGDIGRAGRISAYLDQNLGLDHAGLQLLRVTARDLEALRISAQIDQAPISSRMEVKLVQNLIGKFSAKLAIILKEGPESDVLRENLSSSLEALSAMAAVNRICLAGVVGILVDLAPKLKARCLKVSKPQKSKEPHAPKLHRTVPEITPAHDSEIIAGPTTLKTVPLPANTIAARVSAKQVATKLPRQPEIPTPSSFSASIDPEVIEPEFNLSDIKRFRKDLRQQFAGESVVAIETERLMNAGWEVNDLFRFRCGYVIVHEAFDKMSEIFSLSVNPALPDNAKVFPDEIARIVSPGSRPGRSQMNLPVSNQKVTAILQELKSFHLKPGHEELLSNLIPRILVSASGVAILPPDQNHIFLPLAALRHFEWVICPNESGLDILYSRSSLAMSADGIKNVIRFLERRIAAIDAAGYSYRGGLID